MAKRFYELHVAGCTRQLPVLNISDTLAIAGFVILGDTDIVVRCSKELAEKIPKDTDVIMTAETKGIPLAAEMARILGMKRYVVARKSVKAYMENPIWVEDESITTAGKQRLYLQDADIELMKGKNVLLVDDVISTGGSMKAMKRLSWPKATPPGERILSIWLRCPCLTQRSKREENAIFQFVELLGIGG